MTDINTAFKPLHDTLARLHLLVRLIDDNVTLTAAEEHEIYVWLRDMTATAANQAVEAEEAVARAARGE